MTETTAEGDGAERRGARRTRTRLRPAKLLREDGRFIADCVMENRSEIGARLVFFDEAPERREAVLFDETLGTAVRVALVWRVRRTAGVRFCGRTVKLDRLTRERLGGRYYAVGD